MSDAPMPRPVQRLRLLLALPWVGLAGVGLALAAGVPFARLSVLAADLATAGVAVLATIAFERRKRARARQQRRAEPPRGV
ncbi:MAG TPA: hypothetical protein VLT58_08315, partial [Polyangia bacterium]|nr:hypothetical protein [Polyangia bacterium]